MTIAGAVILAAIAGALHYKHRVPRFVAWVLLLVGVGAAATITNLFGGFTGMNLFGVGVFTLIAIITGIFFSRRLASATAFTVSVPRSSRWCSGSR